MRWQYSCVGLGKDIGADNSAWGVTDSVQVANKDALIWKVAEINRDGSQADYGSAYSDALLVLKDIPASQESVDAALAALNSGGNEEPTRPFTGITLPNGDAVAEEDIVLTEGGYTLWGQNYDLYTVTSLENLKLNYVEVDGLRIPGSLFEEHTESGGYAIDTSSCANLNGREVRIMSNSYGPLIIFSAGVEVNGDISVHFVFESKSNYNTKPVVTSAVDELSLDENSLRYVENTAEGTIWELTANCASGYELRYIQIGEDESTRIYSENGYTIRWEVKDDGAEYTAYGGSVLPHLGVLNFPVLELGISEGQRLEFNCLCSWGSAVLRRIIP